MKTTKGRRIAIATGVVALAVLGLAGLTAWRFWPQIRFRYLFASLGPNAQGFEEFRHRQTGIVMVRLPGGTFWMGAQKTEPKGKNFDPEAGDDEGPVHEVKLSPFLIGKYEVTQAEWVKVMGWNPSNMIRDDLPVEEFHWADIENFLAKTRLLLSTEAQWEYACRAGTTTPFAGTGKLDDMGCYRGNSIGVPRTVGQKAPNGFGLYDFHGNSTEWCEDDYDGKFYKKPEAAGPNPLLKASSMNHVLRGGCWHCEAKSCRSSSRKGEQILSPDEIHMHGLRVVYPAP